MLTFHLDESVNPAIAVALRAHQIDVTTTADAELIGADDERQLAFASNARRVLFTHDDDFLRLHARGRRHAGLLYCHQQKYSIGQLIQLLLMLGLGYDPHEVAGCLEFL